MSSQENIDGDSSPESTTSKEAMFEPKPKPKVIRVLTVLAYVLSVSMAAILLSIYYIFMWEGHPHIGARTSLDLGEENHSNSLLAHSTIPKSETNNFILAKNVHLQNSRQMESLVTNETLETNSREELNSTDSAFTIDAEPVKFLFKRLNMRTSLEAAERIDWSVHCNPKNITIVS